MPQLNRRNALGTAIALCQVSAMAQAQTDAPRDAQTRQVIEAYARAYEKGDLAALVARYHTDFTLNYFGKNALAGRHVGKAASLKILREMLQRTGRKLKSINGILVGGDKTAMITRELLTTKGQTVEVERVYVYTVSGEQLLECWVYDQDQRLIDEIIGA